MMLTARRAVGILAVAIAGCGSGEAAVRGTATVGGRPVTAGTARFEPADGGMTATAVIVDGAFWVPGGLLPGRYSVRVDPPAVKADPDPKAPRPAAPFVAWRQDVAIPPGGSDLRLEKPSGR
jgi:hypothetical protein